jgi:hypothetical protein
MMTLPRGKSFYQFTHAAFGRFPHTWYGEAAQLATFNWGLIAPTSTLVPCYHHTALDEIL